MTETPSDACCGHLPQMLPIFPLAGVLLLPRGRLPLHVFEPRYVAMVEDCLVGDHMIGIIQPTHPNSRDERPPLYATGCAGRITALRELEDHRYLVTLTGICRFRIHEELKPHNGYRQVIPAWDAFASDLKTGIPPGFDRSRLLEALPSYLDEHEIVANWDSLVSAPDERLVASLAMVCPFDPVEKQALLEAPTLSMRGELLTSLIEMAVADARNGLRYGRH